MDKNAKVIYFYYEDKTHNDVRLRKQTLTKGYFFDSSRASAISFKDLGTLNSLRRDLWDEIVAVKDKSLEQPCWWDGGGELCLISENTHDWFCFLNIDKSGKN